MREKIKDLIANGRSLEAIQVAKENASELEIDSQALTQLHLAYEELERRDRMGTMLFAEKNASRSFLIYQLLIHLDPSSSDQLSKLLALDRDPIGAWQQLFKTLDGYRLDRHYDPLPAVIGVNSNTQIKQSLHTFLSDLEVNIEGYDRLIPTLELSDYSRQFLPQYQEEMEALRNLKELIESILSTDFLYQGHYISPPKQLLAYLEIRNAFHLKDGDWYRNLERGMQAYLALFPPDERDIDLMKKWRKLAHLFPNKRNGIFRRLHFEALALDLLVKGIQVLDEYMIRLL